MTLEEIKNATLEEIESRKLEIKALVEANEADTNFETLSAELDTIEERKAFLIEEQRKADVEAVLNGAGETVTENIIPKETRNMADVMEIRNSEAYINAFAEAMKTGDYSECRSLLTVNAPEDGQIVVPTIVEDKIRTAWEESEIFSKISKSNIKGVLSIGFEISGTDAVIHEEGSGAIEEEELTLGAVPIVPKMIKKYITVSDEVMALRGEAFIEYVYDELKYKIVKKAEGVVIAKIIANVGASTATTAGQATTSGDATRATVIDAISYVNSEAKELAILMSRRTWATFEAARTLNTLDPFAELPVIFTSELGDYDTASEDDPFAIVGDLAFGFRANLPNGYEVKISVDENSLSEADLIKVTGKLYAGLEPVAVDAFCVITKAGGEG